MKGQSRMQYLKTYGWALMVIVVIGAALFALGVLNPDTYNPDKRWVCIKNDTISDWTTDISLCKNSSIKYDAADGRWKCYIPLMRCVEKVFGGGNSGGGGSVS